MRHVAALLIVFLGQAAPAPKPEVIKAGALTCEVYISRTATIFHVVDQISGWSEFCHGQYTRHFGGLDGSLLTPVDRELLARHAKIREVRGWGGGLEQAFYKPWNVETAMLAGIKAGHLTEEQAKTEKEIFDHFAPRVDKLIADHRKVLESYPGRLLKEKGRLTEFADRTSKFVGGAKVSVPVYLLANPHDSDLGGGFNGGIVALEIPRVRDAFPTLLHELFHAFLEKRRNLIEEAVKGVEGLDYMTLNEGLAYALSPGIFHTEKPGDDPLAADVKRFEAAGSTLKDYYYRVNRFGLELRPLLKAALDRKDGTLDEVIPKAVGAWRTLADKAKKP